MRTARAYAASIVAVVDADELRSFGQVFDDVAEAYDEARKGYPPELVDLALARGGLAAGARVLEVGCGTGKLTEILAARELDVDAIDPGPNMIGAARRRVGDAATVTFHLGRFEDLELADGAYAALFSATAFHWIDPAVGWRKAATLLAPGGVLALLVHHGVSDGRTKGVDAEFRANLGKYAPELAATLSPDRDLATIVAGVESRRGNASHVWDWIMGERRGLAVDDAAELFEGVEVESVVEEVERTADELTEHLKTTSLYFSVPERSRDAFLEDDRAIIERHGGSLQFSECSFLMTALRR
jgi:SAM-dependent methyltransferase